MTSCGRESGYKQHRRTNTLPCRACLDAHATYNRRRYEKRYVTHGTPEALTYHARSRTPVCDLCLDVACYAERLAARDYFSRVEVAA